MNRCVTSLFLAALLASATVWAQTSAPEPESKPESGADFAPGTDEYRAQADVRLNLLFQGIAEGGISRGLRLFGVRGRCEAWYAISDVIAAPADLPIQAGERLKLSYDCGTDRAYVSELETSVAWAQSNGADAQAWLRSEDIEADRGRTWAIANEENWFAPVALQSPE